MKRFALTLLLIASCTAARAQDATVTHLTADSVSSAFAAGRPLLETGAYKIHASRREKPGMAEVHVLDTDIIHVLSGEATFVTGGQVVEGKDVGPDEIRGRSIDGGDVRKLMAGDVLVVPAGVPHWFRDVQGPLLYYVVKVTTCEGDAS